MKYDFTSIIDRRGMDSLAVDLKPGFGPQPPKEGFDIIPMWVADMSFPTLPTIQEAIIERANHPMFGYFTPKKEYYDSIIKWHEDRNGVTGMTPDHIGYENGVLGCLMSVVDAFSAPGDYILVHSPTYIGFTSSLTNNGRRIILSSLVKDDEGVWRMDYDDMDAKLKKYNIHLAIFCSKNNDCLVISDEIWSDIILYGNKHIPTQSVSEDAKNRTVAIYAPSKTFNLAGLVGAYHIIYNKYLRDRVRAQSSKSHYNQMNVLSMHALIGAYKEEGREWVDELCMVLGENIDYACDHIANNYKGIKFFKPEGTYMLYIDCVEWLKEHGMTLDELYKAGTDAGVMWQDGRPFNHPNAIRINLALPKSRVIEAFDRLDKYVFLR